MNAVETQCSLAAALSTIKKHGHVGSRGALKGGWLLLTRGH